MVCEQGVGCGRDYDWWGYAVEVVGVGVGDWEVFVGEVFCVRTCLPLPLSTVESPLFGFGGCVDVFSCSNDTCVALPLYTILALSRIAWWGTCSSCCIKHMQYTQGEAHSRTHKERWRPKTFSCWFILLPPHTLQCTQSIDKIQHKGKWPIRSINA